MLNSGPLVILGIVVIVATAAAILVPYLRGKSDAVTAWNIVLLGGALFVGVGCLSVAYGDFHWPELQWFQPTKSDVQQYILGTIVFYLTMFVTYFIFSWPKRLSANFLNKWPPPTLAVLIFSLIIFGIIALATPFTRNVVFVGSLLINISHKALVFGVVFSFCHWYQNKRQLPFFFLFLGVFVIAALNAMVVFGGRRLLLSVAVAPLICMYWLHWRYSSPKKNLVRLGLATFLALAVTAFYSTFRHFDSKGDTQRTVSTTVQAMKGASAEKALKAVTNNAFFYFSQYCAHYSLLTIHLIDNEQVQVEPLHSVIYWVTYPVPRAIFPNKPEPLSLRLVSDVLRMPYRTNWGLGIVGTGYHEGGLAVIMLYALLIVLGCRLIDDALVRQPNNPFLLGILCTASPHLAALIRGEFSTLSTDIVESFVFAWGLGLLARFFYGTSRAGGPSGMSPQSRTHFGGHAPHAGR
jgi:hypothetical protein